jgi:hypothetical protein
MQNIRSTMDSLDWETITENMHAAGYAVIPGICSPAACASLKAGYDDPTLYRKTVIMERYRFGLGAYKYFDYPLPPLLQEIRENVYPQLVPIANAWMNTLHIDRKFPGTFEAFQQLCHDAGQQKAAALILKYGQGGHNTLHQDLYGEVYFPIQAVLFLNEPGVDFTGGEFVLTEQIPRAQSKAIVLNPRQGDLLFFTTHFRPVKGSKGYYRVNMKHGVSQVHSGERYTLGIIFHDALT